MTGHPPLLAGRPEKATLEGAFQQHARCNDYDLQCESGGLLDCPPAIPTEVTYAADRARGRCRCRPVSSAARRRGAEVREDCSRGNSWPRSSSEPTGPGDVGLDQLFLDLDETARLGRWPKHDRRATFWRISRSASHR